MALSTKDVEDYNQQDRSIIAANGLDPMTTPDPGQDIDIDQDVYGATIFSVIYDLAELITGVDLDELGAWMNLTRLVFVLLTLMANFTLQVGLLYWIYFYIVLQSVHKAETIYQKYHADCFQDGQFVKALFDKWDYKPDLCGLGFANFGFMFAIQCLWWTVMLNEVRKNEQLLTTIMALPHTTNALEMVQVGEDDGVVRFKALTGPVRRTLYVVLILPKILICISLLVIGTVWLTSTCSFADLILNAIALEFVIEVDELLFQALLPSFICQRIDNTKFWMPSTSDSLEAKKRTFLVGYRRSYLYLFGTMASVYCFLTLGQLLPVIGVFPGFEDDVYCDDFNGESTRWLCIMGQECFTLG